MYNGKRTGKYSGKRAGKNTALILALILFLTLNIGGTIAFLYRQSAAVQNTFVAGNVKIAIEETVSAGVKSRIQIKNDKNKGSNIPVYIRVALVGNWATAEDEICVKHGNSVPSFTLGSGWVEHDGFYYYTKPVDPGELTEDLLDTDITLSTKTDGCSYQLEVIASAIQAVGEDGTKKAVVDAWGLDPGTPGQP